MASGILKFMEDNPTVTIGGGIVGVLLIGAVIMRKNAASTAATTAAGGSDLSGLATDANGNHVVYVPTSTEFYTDNSVSATSAPNAPATIGNVGSPTTTNRTNTTTAPAPQPVVVSKPPPHGSDNGHGGTSTGGTHPTKTPPPVQPPAKSIHWTKGHHVGTGETLTSIAAQATNAVRSQGLRTFTVTWNQIYEHNRQTIDSKAASMHGKTPYYNDVYPGELIVVPEYR